MSPEGSTGGDDGAQIGPGALALVVGASGVGKDALIAGARAILGDDPHFVFAERVVTRASHGAEHHETLSEADFLSAEQEGRFALTWGAHDLHYGIPASIDDEIRRGRTVIINGSRAASGAARRRYARVGLILIECPASIRAERLAQRGRESAADVEARLARQVTSFDPAEADVRIDNSGALADGVQALLATLRSLAASLSNRG